MMTERIHGLFLKMIAFDAGDPDLIQHFTKVFAYSALIARAEGLDARTAEILEAAALVHDIAIPLCNEKYGAHPGPLQEREGPPLVRQLLAGTDFSEEETARICTLVGEHHTWTPVDGIDHQILLEADLLVNAFENGYSREDLAQALKTRVATAAGRQIFGRMFGLE